MAELTQTMTHGGPVRLTSAALDAVIEAPGASTVRFSVRLAPGLAQPEQAAPAYIEDDAARFAAEAERRGLADEDLEHFEGACWRRFAMLFGSAAALLAFAISQGGTAGFLCLPFVALLAVKAAEAAHAHWQLRTRAFGSLGAWLRQPAEWWPLSARPQPEPVEPAPPGTPLLTFQPTPTLNFGGRTHG